MVKRKVPLLETGPDLSGSEIMPSRQEPRRLRTRAALLSAGQALLADRTIDALAVNEIVEAAGVAKGSFFNHFADKESFAAEIAGTIRLAIEADVANVNIDVTDPARRVARGMCRFMRFAHDDPQATRIMMRGLGNSIAAEHPLNRGLVDDLSLGVKQKRFNPHATRGGPLMVIGVCQMLLMTVLNETGASRETQAISAIGLTLVALGLESDEAHQLATSAYRDVVKAPKLLPDA
jgi:AcrR family transcriptional regulator